MIATGAWKDLVFKPYNYNSMGTLPEGGHLHPLLKVRAQIRQIFLEMGFTEMPTNNYVESSFWNFDALFQPQQHPAREAHDTFFLSEPALSHQFPRDYLEQVKRVHSRGGFGSQGYGYEWQEEEAQKNLLRTHTTAVSARMLYKLAKEGFRPAKYFSIDRVFRNEELDATHLAEFQQVEGVIADHNLTLGNLIGVLSEFFKKMGMDQLRFKPAYNPYTEPSMEIFSYHNGLGKWIEVGNSGVFRPEMLLPMGLPEDVNVIAWGLSLERPTMIKYGIDNIRDLVGPRVDLQMVYDNPICRLDKEPTIEDKARSVEDTWQLLSFQVERMKNEIRRLHSLVNQSRHIICVDPSTPPYSLLVLLRLVKSFASKTVSVETNLHSALPLLSSYFNYYLSTDSRDTQHGKGSADFNFSFVWKQSGEVKLSFCSSQRDIVGEVNVCRYLARIAEENSSTLTLYERKGEVKSSQIDECVDIIHSLLTTSNREKQSDLLKRVDKLLVASPFITGSSVSVADICLWSAINQLSDIDIIPLNIRKFFVRCCNHPWFAPHLSLN
ncbi:phenylalanine--tRNA ligase alpha subunit isoform X2 [Anabrus simplex]